jgi:exodeoxyribonuclease V beta subunit
MAFEPFLAYEASAGSGKTFMLVVRYLSLLFLGKEPSKILALTFTNKAANEMLERIVATLETLHMRHDGELREISRVINKSPDEILALRDEVLERFLRSDTKVMTIDKFLAIVLRKFSLHAGIAPTFSTHESQHDIKVLKRFLNELAVGLKEESLINLTLINHARLSETIGLLHQLYMLRSKLNIDAYAPHAYLHVKEEILADVAALRVLVASQAGASTAAINTMTLTSFEALLSKEWYKKETLNYRTYSKCFVPQMDEMLHEIQSKMRRYYDLKDQNYFYELFALLQTFENSKLKVAKEDNELGFDDVTALVYNMLHHESISRDFLYFRLDAQIDHLLLDEFQDTSMVQFEILEPIISEICSGVGVKGEKSLFFVGDVKQSIYRFRGGIKELFYEVVKRYGVAVELLVTNYRSSAAVVDFVNQTFEHKIRGYNAQKIKDNATQGYVEVVVNDALLEGLLEHIKQLLDLGISSNDIAVLCATNKDGQLVEEALKAQNIEVVTETTSKLINQQNIQALIEYVKYLYFKEEIYARNFFSLINLPYEPVAYVDCNQIDLVPHMKKVIEEYGLYEGDLNIIRFLEVLYASSDIEAFIYEYERIDASSVRAENMGVKVLTVHKSKGLEYDHVIVLDRFSREKPNNSRLVYEYDGVNLAQVHLRQKGRDSIDERYAQALAKDAVLGTEDRLNALYVAFTRAKESLLIIKKEKGSQFDLLDLQSLQIGSLQAKEEAKAIDEVPKAIIYAPLELGVQEGVLKSETEDEKDLYAIDFGLALHYALELSDLHESSTTSMSMESVKNRFGARLGDEDFEAIASRIEMLLRDSEFLNMVQGEIFKEQPIAYNSELRYIDVLVDKGSEMIVIDYKSSRRYEASHIKQVGFYKKAVEHIAKKPVRASLVYLLEDEILIRDL